MALQKYKLIILPYPLMMTGDEARALKEYVNKGGHLFVEARPGWVNEDGHAEAMVPGFGWQEIFGVKESSIDPGKEFTVRKKNVFGLNLRIVTSGGKRYIPIDFERSEASGETAYDFTEAYEKRQRMARLTASGSLQVEKCQQAGVPP